MLVNKYIRYLTTAQARLTTGVVLIAAIVLGLGPDHNRPVDPARAVAVIVAALAWIFAELGASHEPSAHDKTLFGTIVDKLPEGHLNFLRNQDFGVSSYYNFATDILHEIASWHGSRYQFIDSAIQGDWAKLHSSVKQFSHSLGVNTWSVAGSSELRTVHPNAVDAEDPDEQTEVRIKLLNDRASQLSQQIDAFEPATRIRLRL